MKSKDLISIIIPIYNAEKSLNRCLESIKNQTYINLEILLIDDGSSDNSSKICKKFCEHDQRFIYFKNENQGVAKTRDFGIQKSRGKYLTFVDSDDYISCKYIELLYDLLIQNKSDISICLSRKVYDEKENIANDDKMLKNNVILYDNFEAIEDMLYEKKIDTSFWGKMYKSQLLKKIRISDYKIFEDLDTMYKILLKCDSVCLTDSKLYYYYIRKDSLSHNTFSEKNILVLEILDELEQNITKITKKLSNAILARKMNANFYILRNTKKDSVEYINAKRFIKNNRFKVLKNKKISKKLFFGIMISYLSFDLISPFFNFITFLKKSF